MQGYISAIKCPVSVNHKYQERKNNDQYQNIRKQLLSLQGPPQAFITHIFPFTILTNTPEKKIQHHHDCFDS